jgi:hypothetical protein
MKIQCVSPSALFVSGNLVLRVPVLYGPVEYLAESAVTVLLNSLLQTDKPCKISDCELRRPSHVDDIADICLHMAVKRLEVSVLYGIGTVYFNYLSLYRKGKEASPYLKYYNSHLYNAYH